MPFNFGDIPLILQELRRYFASKAQGTLADSALQPGAIGSTVQAYHARLDSLSGITNADGGIEKTGANTYGRYALTTFGKSLVDDADASTARSTLGLTIGSNVQAWDGDLDAIAALTETGFLERTGSNSWGVSDRVRTFGGNGSDGAYTSTNGATLDQGIYFFTSFTVSSGHTITISRFARIYCSSAIINGTINVTQAVDSLGNAGIYASAINTFPGFGLGGPNGGTYNPFIQPYGSSGRHGDGSNYFGNAAFDTGKAGRGGGGFWIESTGAILIGATGAINAIGSDGIPPFGPPTTSLGGGGGGGSGGAIGLSSLVSITASSGSTLNVRGGNGGAGYTANSGVIGAGGGGGGGGGWVVLIAPSVTTTGSTITLSGGSAGANAGTAANIAGGSGGGFAGAGGTPQSAGSIGQLVIRTIKGVA